MTTTTVNDYWISASAISISLNAMGNPDYAQIGIANNASIVAFVRGIIDYDNSHKCRSWRLTGSPTAFGDSTEKYVYVAIPRTDNPDMPNAIVVFPSELIDIYGRNEAGEQLGSADYYYIYLHGKITASVVGGVDKQRRLEPDFKTGELMSDYALMNKTDSEWYSYNAVTGRVSFLKEIIMEGPGKFLNLLADKLTATTATLTRLILGGKTVTGIADADTDKDSDLHLLTPKGAQHFMLSKLDDDTAEGNMTFRKKVDVFGNFVAKQNATISGSADIQGAATVQGNFTVGKGHAGSQTYSETSTGWRIDAEGRAVMDSLKLRRFLEVPELNYNRVTVNAGVDWKTFGGGVIEVATQVGGTVIIDGALDDYDGIIKLKLQDGEVGSVVRNDLCMGIFHSTEAGGNETETTDDHRGNFKFQGFQTVYFRVVAICNSSGDVDHPDSRNQYFLYQLREPDEHWTSMAHPQPGMNFACYANPTHATRQANVYQALDYTIMLVNMTTWEYGTDNIMYIVGNLNHFTINVKDAAGNVTPMQLEGYGIAFGNAYMWGNIQQVNRDRYIVSQQSYYYSSNDTQSVVTQQWRDHELTIADFSTTPIVPTASAQYVYMVWRYNYSSGDPVYSDPACSAVYGSAGLGVSKVTAYFKRSAADAIPTPLPVLRSDRKAVTNYNFWLPTTPAPDDEMPYLFGMDIITFTDGTLSLGNPHCVGTKGTNGRDGADGALPNMYGYDSNLSVLSAGNCLKYPLHTYDGFTLIFSGESEGEHTVYVDLQRINALRKYAVHGTLSAPFVPSDYKLHVFLADEDLVPVTEDTVSLISTSDRSFNLSFSPNFVCRYVGFTLAKGNDTPVRALWTISQLKVEDVTSIAGSSTLFVDLASDTLPVCENLLQRSADFGSTLWHNTELSGTTIVPHALQGNSAVRYIGGARVDSDQYGNVNVLYYYVTLKSDTAYTLSWWQRGKGVIYTYLNFATADDSPVVYDCKRATLGNGAHLMSERWERHSMTVYTGSNTEGAYLRFSVERSYNIEGNEYHLAMLKLEECERMTDWQQNELDRKGEAGEPGLEGCVTRPCGLWRDDVVYVNQSGSSAPVADVRYIDIVLYQNAAGNYNKYKRTTRTEGYEAGIPPTNTDFWTSANNFDFVATDLFMSEEAWISHLTGKSVYVTDSNGTVQAGIQSVTNNDVPQIFAGANQEGAANAAYRVYRDGRLVSTNADITGTIHAMNGDFKGRLESNEGYFSGIIKRTKTIINKDNWFDYVEEEEEEGVYLFDFTKIGTYVEFQDNPPYPMIGWPFFVPSIYPNSLYRPEYAEEVRSLVGTKIILVNKSSVNVTATGFCSERLDNPSSVSVAIAPNMMRIFECVLDFKDGKEIIFWYTKVGSPCDMI